MLNMGWSWEQLRRTPYYVRKVNWEILCMKGERQRQLADKAAAEAERRSRNARR